MLAIPLDEKESTTISKFYGNAPFFALYDGKELKVVENEVCGKGPASAKFLKSKGASSTVYYHMGDGVYKAFAKENMDVYTSEHKEYLISQAYEMLKSGELKKLDESNYKQLLDPGSNGECTCGCENK
ncbi:MAG: putative Fe-Mo cluster-binding NifX family protein [Sulfurimonas sp.]|jgi:predicted Fe-Mo cluster-binding NifX family protein